MVAAGRLGRKAGRGYYDYAADGSYRPDDPAPPAPGGGDGAVVAMPARAAGRRAARARPRRRLTSCARAAPPSWLSTPAPRPHPLAAGRWPAGGAVRRQSLAARGEPGAVGFHLLPPLDAARLVELTRLPTTPAFAAEAAERFFGSPRLPLRVGRGRAGARARPDRLPARERGRLRDRRGRGLGRRRRRRARARPEPPARAGRVERGDRPRARGSRCSTGLWAERREERYRTAPLLRRQLALGRSLRG